MPIISSFFGIYIRMYFADHAPPPIHVDYQGHEALVASADGSLVEREFPRRAMTLVRQWCLDHRAELEQNWVSAQALQPPSRIPGADNDQAESGRVERRLSLAAALFGWHGRRV